MKPLSYFFFADILEDPIKERVLRHFYDTLLKIYGREPRSTMEFTVEKPVYDSVNKCHQLVIVSPPVFVQKGGDLSGMVFKNGIGEQSEQFEQFVQMFLDKASSYFSKPLNRALFMDRVVHIYSIGEHEVDGQSIKQISWIPARVLFYPTRYEIRWRLLAFEKIDSSPGTTIQEAEIETFSSRPPPRRMLHPVAAQQQIRQKIRQARIRCAFAKLNLERLTEKYYSKYGNFDGLGNADSELSSAGE